MCSVITPLLLVYYTLLYILGFICHLKLDINHSGGVVHLVMYSIGEFAEIAGGSWSIKPRLYCNHR